MTSGQAAVPAAPRRGRCDSPCGVHVQLPSSAPGACAAARYGPGSAHRPARFETDQQEGPRCDSPWRRDSPRWRDSPRDSPCDSPRGVRVQTAEDEKTATDEMKAKLKESMKAKSDMFEDMCKHEEDLRLGESGWKERYYQVGPPCVRPPPAQPFALAHFIITCLYCCCLLVS